MLNLLNPRFVKFMLASLLSLSATTLWAQSVEYDGLIEPYEVIEIGAPAQGIVADVAVDRSSTVETGQLLVSLESSVERAAFDKAKAMVGLKGDIDMQQAQLKFAKRVHERVRKVRSVSAHDRDQAATDIVLTWHRLEKARENRALAKIELKRSRALLARRQIKSPVSGVVVERYVSPGEYVNNQPLLRVAQIDPLRVEVIVPAHMFGKILPGMTATIHPELSTYGQRTATVTIVDKVIDAASSTFGVRLNLPNPEFQMPSGLKCLVRFDMDTRANQAEEAFSLKAPDQALK